MLLIVDPKLIIKSTFTLSGIGYFLQNILAQGHVVTFNTAQTYKEGINNLHSENKACQVAQVNSFR